MGMAEITMKCQKCKNDYILISERRKLVFVCKKCKRKEMTKNDS